MVVYLQPSNSIEIDGGSVWPPNVAMASANHDMGNQAKQWQNTESIKVEEYCWINAGAVILPCVVLGDKVVVNAGTVVRKSFLQGNVVVVGNPDM